MMSPHFPSGPSVGKSGPVWSPCPCWTIESASVVIKLYGLLTSAVRWQNETGSPPGPGVVGALPGAGAVAVGPGDVNTGAVVPVVVDELDGGVVAVDDEDEGVGGVVVGDVVAEVVPDVVVVSSCAPDRR